jgi:hypothetical protein
MSHPTPPKPEGPLAEALDVDAEPAGWVRIAQPPRAWFWDRWFAGRDRPAAAR